MGIVKSVLYLLKNGRARNIANFETNGGREMSGGSHNYAYSTIEDTYVDEMHDPILNEMMRDLVNVLYDLEWWQSGDYGEEKYRETVKEFKEKYFKNYNETTKQIIIYEVNKILEEAGIQGGIK